jgi:hypothetical protein
MVLAIASRRRVPETNKWIAKKNAEAAAKVNISSLRIHRETSRAVHATTESLEHLPNLQCEFIFFNPLRALTFDPLSY